MRRCVLRKLLCYLQHLLRTDFAGFNLSTLHFDILEHLKEGAASKSDFATAPLVLYLDTKAIQSHTILWHWIRYLIR